MTPASPLSPATTDLSARSGAEAKGFVTYEQLLNQDTRWALSEGSLFFEGRGHVQETLKRITTRLEELGIPYAVAGGMALFLHDYRRFTEDVNILVTRESLFRIHQELEGRGYVRPFEKSKNLRDTDSKVKIEFLVTGGYPGDGKPKDIAFPDPAKVAVLKHGIRVLNLEQLISLKLASGMTGDGRTKDLADVEELIKGRGLPESLAGSLHPYVQDRYRTIWRRLYSTPKRYLWLLGKTPQTAHVKSLDDLIVAVGKNFPEFAQMRDAGVELAPDDASNTHFVLQTSDPKVAEQFKMIDEAEFWDLDNASSNLPN
jgi:hypothetical protein